MNIVFAFRHLQLSLACSTFRRHPWFRVALPPYLSSATCLRASLSISLDAEIVQEMLNVRLFLPLTAVSTLSTILVFLSVLQLGYNVDPDSLVIFPKPGSFPSRTTVAYQLLADRKAMLKSLSRSTATQTPTAFSFAREVQKRVAAACGVVGNDATPFHWASDMTFGVGQYGPTALVGRVTSIFECVNGSLVTLSSFFV